MDVAELLSLEPSKDSGRIELTGWLMDRNDGLYLVADHAPLNWDFLLRVKIVNDNIMYLIQKKISFYGGGKSSLFHKCKLDGEFISGVLPSVFVKKLYVARNGDNGEFEEIRIDDEELRDLVDRRGNYRFIQNRDPGRDWLDDL